MTTSSSNPQTTVNSLVPTQPQHPGPYALAIPLSQLSSFGGNQAMMHPSQAPPVRSLFVEDLVRCILRRWKLSALLSGVLCALLLFFLLGRQPEFLAEANIMMRIRDDKVFNFERVVDNSSSEASNVIMLLNNHRVEMKSRRFLEFFFAGLTPEQRAEIVAPPAHPTLVTRLMNRIQPPPPTDGVPEEEIAKRKFMDLCERAPVDFIKETLIIKVAVRHHDPDQAAALANRWVQSYMDYVAHEEKSSTRQASTFLREEANQARERVQASEEKLAAYSREKGLVDDAEQLAGDGEKLKVLSSEQTRREVDLAEITQTLLQVDAAGDDVEKLLAVDGFSQLPALSTLRAQLTEKLREREVLQQRYLPKHPAVLSFEKGFASLQSEIRKALNRTIGELRNRHTSLTNQVAAIHGQLGNAKGGVAGNGADNVERKMLRSQLQSDRALYEKLLSRLEEALVSSRFSEVTHLRLAETATPPRKPVAPNKPLSLVLAGVSFGSLFMIIPLVLAAGGILRAHGIIGLMTRFRSPDPAASVPVVASSHLRQMVPEGNDLGELPALTQVESDRPETMVYGIFQHECRERQIFNEMLDHLISDPSVPAGKAPVVLLTSVRRGEGKSLVAAGLGIAGALKHKRVVLIEGNLRRPAVHQFFPRKVPVPSLGDAARESSKLELSPEVLRFPGSELFTLEAGDLHGLDREHLFDSAWFARMIQVFRSSSDLIILDSPSLREVPESEQLAMLATRALVVGSGSGGRSELPSVATRLLQLVPHLTKADYLLNQLPA